MRARRTCRQDSWPGAGAEAPVPQAPSRRAAWREESGHKQEMLITSSPWWLPACPAHIHGVSSTKCSLVLASGHLGDVFSLILTSS